MAQTEEWDWPPPPRARLRQVEGRITKERIIIPVSRSVPKRQANRATRLADAFGSFLFLLIRLALAAALSGVVLACLFLISAIVKA